MNKNELDQSLEFLFKEQNEIQIVIYTILKDGNDPLKLSISFDDLPEIKNLFTKGIKSSILEKEDYTILALSTADERKNCYYSYDLELPEELKNLEKVTGNDNIPLFDFSKKKLSDIDSLIIVLADNENSVTLYKKLSSIEVVGRGGYMLWKSNQRLERFNDQMLRISPGFQAIRANNEVVILDLGSIEKSFGFHDVIAREANASITVISEMKILSDIDSLASLVSNVSFARKLTKVGRSSPVIKNRIPNENIIAFSKSHPATKNRMRYTADNRQFNLDTKTSKDLFIKLLNDDFLTSELTRLYYESLAKDSYELPVDNQNNQEQKIN